MNDNYLDYVNFIRKSKTEKEMWEHIENVADEEVVKEKGDYYWVSHFSKLPLEELDS